MFHRLPNPTLPEAGCGKHAARPCGILEPLVVTSLSYTGLVRDGGPVHDGAPVALQAGIDVAKCSPSIQRQGSCCRGFVGNFGLLFSPPVIHIGCILKRGLERS